MGRVLSDGMRMIRDSCIYFRTLSWYYPSEMDKNHKKVSMIRMEPGAIEDKAGLLTTQQHSMHS
jgi:hypothetical protein